LDNQFSERSAHDPERRFISHVLDEHDAVTLKRVDLLLSQHAALLST
jgi:hypothetical protein